MILQARFERHQPNPQSHRPVSVDDVVPAI